ncbi:MAG: S49 family peptidase [Desulfobacteraceae bacterium 4484_190.3]|nr:MAG: S49 family peptidase [Desulfobacteraceae bacterium 4484_190.3]
MRRHPIIFGLLLLVIVGILFFLVISLMAFFTEGRKIISLKDQVGVVIIKGVIGKSREIIDQLDKYGEDDDIKAVVLRIDSPGGAVVPSQEIYDKVLQLKKKKKVFTSMGSVAASGGYYIACASDKIVANPGTITGSIGVIIQFPQAKELLKKIGLKSTVIKHGKYKDIGSPSRDMTSDERLLMQGVVDDIYDQFVEAVSLNRNIPKKKIEALADGRIFSGRQALNLGLVDYVGNMEYTIDLAARLSGIKGKPEVVYPKKRRLGLLRYLVKEIVSTVSREFREEETGIQYIYTN